MAVKVLIISQMYPSCAEKNRGIFVHKQVKELIKQGCQVKVISPVPLAPFAVRFFSKKWQDYSKIPLKTIMDGVEIYYPRYVDFPKALFFSFSGQRMYKGIKTTVSCLDKNFKFDIIHAHTVLPAGYAGMEVAKQYKKPLIVTVHGADFQKTIFKNKRCVDVLKRVINFSKKTIVVSNKLKNIGQKELNIENHKIEVIPNGIDQESVFNGKSNLAEQHQGKKIILSISNLVKIKGIDFNLKAIKKLEKEYPNLIYFIIGRGEERKNLENIAKELKLENKVEFLGQLPHEKIMEYASICDIFSLPSWKEGFGIAYLEAMAQEKPVIACKGEGAEDFIYNKKNGILVEPKNVNDLSEAIKFLLSNPERAKEIAREAKNTVFERYTLNKVARQIVDLYNQNKHLKNEEN